MTAEPQIFQTDWLASTPVFFHEKTHRISTCIHDVIDDRTLELDPEGLRIYLQFGYSALGTTPIRYVRILPPNSRIQAGPEGLMIEKLQDPAEAWLDRQSSEKDTIELFFSLVREWESRQPGTIVVPTSGGFDSRLLNLALADRSRVRAFTYGISADQDQSREVVYARKLTELLGFSWKRIPLGGFHRYFDAWEAMFGASTHAHGMYQMAFSSQIAELIPGPRSLLSGIVGDLWAGSVPRMKIESPADIVRLGYSHGIHADASRCLLSGGDAPLERFFEENRERLASPAFQTVTVIRFKLTLLSYLLSVPESLGFRSWSPFLDPNVALMMLTLPAHRRQGRVWQRDLFRQAGIDLESMDLPHDPGNRLDLDAIQVDPPRPLDAKLLSEVIDPRYVEWINRSYPGNSLSIRMTKRVLATRGWRRLGKWLDLTDPQLPAYNAYLTLRPIENLLRRRNTS